MWGRGEALRAPPWDTPPQFLSSHSSLRGSCGGTAGGSPQRSRRARQVGSRS